MEFHSSEQTIGWFRDRYRDGELIIKPPYQRKPVWAAKQKCFLVESVLLRLPIPEIYMQETTNSEGKTIHALVDGQQRIRTILQFVGGETDPDQEAENKFRLDKLPASSQWYNCSFMDLSDVSKSLFYGYRFQVRHLTTNNDGEIRDMFKRLNMYLTPLNAQELRNATFTGPFITLCNRLAENEYWVEGGIVSPAAIRRMNDVEFVSELLIGVLHGPQGGSDAIVNDYYTSYEDYDDEFPEQRRASSVFNATLELISTTVRDIKQTRWSNKTDFYSLFVALAQIITLDKTVSFARPKLRLALNRFGFNVDTRVADEGAIVSDDVKRYARAVQRGANDKARRAERHEALTSFLSRIATKPGKSLKA